VAEAAVVPERAHARDSELTKPEAVRPAGITPRRLAIVFASAIVFAQARDG
jgi:hypothetical protein